MRKKEKPLGIPAAPRTPPVFKPLKMSPAMSQAAARAAIQPEQVNMGRDQTWRTILGHN